MKPIDINLLAIASAGGSVQPVQLQKSLFLLAQKTPHDFLSPDARYAFVPYDYGPFCADIYSDAEELERDGFVSIRRPPQSRYKEYSATPLGMHEATKIRAALNPKVAEFLESLVAYTRSISFNQLVSAVYSEYPDMKVNSVFKETR